MEASTECHATAVLWSASVRSFVHSILNISVAVSTGKISHCPVTNNRSPGTRQIDALQCKPLETKYGAIMS